MLSNQTLLIKDILIGAIKMGSTDLHFSVGNKPAYKINNQWMPMEEREVITDEFNSNLAAELLDENNKKKLQEEKEIYLSYDFDNDLRFKINLFYQKGVLSATFRHIPTRVPTIDSLGLNPILKKMIETKKGLILIAGSFGSGRTTTAAAMIEEINRKSKKYIITIEQPIEYIFSNNESIIEQREVGKDTRSFEDALRYFQEEAGDVLLLETVPETKLWPIALEIASGSSLVITTINSDSTIGSLATIIDSFTSLDQERIRDLLSNGLRAIVCQKLIPRLGGGSIAVQEVLIVNDAIRSLIKSGNINQIYNILQVSKKDGMTTFDQVIADLVKTRKISTESGLENVVDKKYLENLLQ